MFELLEEREKALENIQEQLRYIGEDPSREGLQETPLRIVRSWRELYSGYAVDVKDLFTTFTETDDYSQIVLLANIDFYSMCEHHMLPFYGKAHVAYLPKGKVLGISKLARLVEAFARRLQIQERIGQQVTAALMEYLQPEGSACIIEATHMCMRMRGVKEHNSVMVTSSLEGVFRKDGAIKAELLELIKLTKNG